MPSDPFKGEAVDDLSARKPAKGNRIVVASRLFRPEVAAASFRLDALAEALTESGAHVLVLTSRPPRGAVGARDRAGVRVSRFPVLRDRDGNVRGYLQYLSFDIPLFFRLLVARADLGGAEPPPTTGLVVLLSSWLRHRPFAYYAADIWTDAVASVPVPHIVVRLMRRVEGAVLRRAVVVLAVSDEVAARVREFGADNVSPVGNGVDTRVFTVNGPAADDSARYFVYAGTMSEWQGADVFVDALPIVLASAPGTQLHIFGQGSELASLRTRAAEVAPGSVHFHGVVSPEETARWLRSATASLVSIKPSLGYDFAKPTKLYAAAACGTPVLFAGEGSGKELVTDGHLGIAVDYAPDAVAGAMLELVAQQEHGTSAHLRASRATWASANASLRTVGARAASVVLSVNFKRREGQKR